MNWFPLPNGKALLVAVILSLFAWLAVSNWGFRKELKLIQQQLSTSQLENSKQAGLIATLQAQDEANRALVAAQQQQEQQLRQQADIYQRKYRDAIKNDECASRNAPGAVLDLMHGKDTNAASANSPATP
ncbi:hypothetical protein [Serratia plymuthica]|uniref:hypothetical protein n=1 Tax=Serratia plymuthica TaxID=82996 RepID=UPI0004562659|nr:hypothetical protein [Serratia plymuthica]AHY06733.1 hypothetical protein sch_09210 [Serratia plymuthica]